MLVILLVSIRLLSRWKFCLFYDIMKENQLPVSAARWQHWSQLGFATFILWKIADNSATTEAREKISTFLESIEFQKLFDVCLTKFENCQILLNQFSHWCLVTTKLFSVWKSLIANSFIICSLTELGQCLFIIKKYGKNTY